jgi:hypothetical protein
VIRGSSLFCLIASSVIGFCSSVCVLFSGSVRFGSGSVRFGSVLFPFRFSFGGRVFLHRVSLDKGEYLPRFYSDRGLDQRGDIRQSRDLHNLTDE